MQLSEAHVIDQNIFEGTAKSKNAKKLIAHLTAIPVSQEIADELAALVRKS